MYKKSTVLTRKRQHSQECKDPRRQRFCDLRPWSLTFWPQIIVFLGLIVERLYTHLYVKSSDTAASVFRHRARKQTDKQRWKPYPNHPPPRLLYNRTKTTSCSVIVQRAHVYQGLPLSTSHGDGMMHRRTDTSNSRMRERLNGRVT